MVYTCLNSDNQELSEVKMAKPSLGNKIGTATIKRKKIIHETSEVAIVELVRPRPKSRATHALISDTGEALGLLSLDAEGEFCIETLITPGEVTGFYLD